MEELTIPQLISLVGQSTVQNRALYGQYKESKEQEDQARALLQSKLQEEGMLSAKTENYVVSIAKKTDVNVIDDKAAIAWMRERKLDLNYYVGLKKTEFKTMARAMLKETGEVAGGTEVVEIESLSIRENKKPQ